MEDKKDLEIVSGDGSNLIISPVYDNLNAVKPKTIKDKPKNIVIPKKHENKDEEDKMIYCSIHLVTLPFWQRLLGAIKYVFGYKCKYGNFEEIILNHKHADKLIELGNFLKD